MNTEKRRRWTEFKRVVFGQAQLACVLLATLLVAAAPVTSAATPFTSAPALPSYMAEVERALRAPWATVKLNIDWAARRQAYQEDAETAEGGDALWLDDSELEAASWYYIHALSGWGVRHTRLLARAPRDLPGVGPEGAWVALDALLRPLPAVPERPWEGELGPPPPRAPSPALVGQPWAGSASGALSGKVVYLSPGHGWYWSDTLGRWATQRGATHNLVEDFVNAEGALHYLVPLLRNAGATVVGVRELDLRPTMALVDNDSGAAYQEKGSWKAGSAKGFAGGKAPYKGAVNPFTLGGYRAAKVSQGSATAVATWTAKIPKPGRYTVYVGYTANTNRAADAHYQVHHAGGVTDVRIDQRRHGQTWTALGQFWFDKSGKVRLLNDSKGPSDRYVIADVVRFGGGKGEIVRGKGAFPAKGPTSGRPRWEECARYYAQYAGAPPSVFDTSSNDHKDDVTTRSRFAAWHHEQGEDAVYLSWHTNAPSPGRGTSTYVYGPNPPNGSKNYQGVKGSAAFGGLLQKLIVADIRAAFDPTWKSRGLYSAYFGELNPKYNPEMPAALVEAAFHATKADADYLREPRFRHLLARAMTKAIITYFAQRDGKPVALPPEPPRDLNLTSAGLLTWKSGPSGGVNGQKAQQYIVQTSSDGRAFDLGTVVKQTSLQLLMPQGNKPLYARVLAVNAGGVSLASAVVGASGGCTSGVDVWIVDGFTRMQASQMPVEDLSPWALGSIQRLRQWKMNTYDYQKEWLDAVAAAGRTTGGLHRSAFTQTAIPASVRTILWAAGEQSTKDGVLSKAERDKLRDWLQLGGGRALLLSGAEVTWALDKKGDKASADWLATWFGARYGADDAGVHSVAPAPGVAMSWAGGAFDDGTGSTYDVDYPDVLKLVGASALLTYGGGAGDVAASRYTLGGATTVLLGFPLETVAPASTRRALMAALLKSMATPASFPGACGAAIADGGVADGGAVDGGVATDAAVGDTSPDTSATDTGAADSGDTGSDAPPDAAPDGVASQDGGGGGDALVPRPDGGAPADGSIGADGRAGSDGVAGMDGLLGADGFAPENLAPKSPDPGCGCTVRGDATPPSGGTFALLALLLGSLLLRRRRAGGAQRARG